MDEHSYRNDGPGREAAAAPAAAAAAAAAAGVKAVDAREQSHSTPLSIHHLWKRPVVRQYLQGGLLHKENVERKPSLFELALDLSYAGVVHALAGVAAEEHSGLAVRRSCPIR